MSCLKKLYDKRLELRQAYNNKHICSDEALVQVAALKPLKLSDFQAVSGLDSDFIDLFGSLFLNVIKNHNTVNDHQIKLTKSAFKVLDHYKDRLSNISRTNPNLYIGRIDKNRSFDLTRIENDDAVRQFITSRQKELPLKNLTDAQQDHLTTLFREVSKDQKESGSYDLYIGYPFIEGIF